MKTKLAQTRTPGAGRSTGPEMEDAALSVDGVDLPASDATHASREPALALHMGLPSTRLDAVLGGPHPLLVELVRHLARTAARADHACTPPTLINVDMTQENL